MRLSLLLLLTLTTGLPTAAQVPILVQERAGIARTSEPVTLGVPFARGELAADAPVHLVDPQGTPVPAQFQPMAVWDDGSVKWLKTDFLASVPASRTAEYALEPGTASTEAGELDVMETSEAVTVTTGPLRFVVSKTAFTLFEQAWLDLDGDRSYEPDEQLIDPEDTFGAAAYLGLRAFLMDVEPPAMVEVEEAGPLKAVIRIAGRHVDPEPPAADRWLKYEVRIYAYAGQSAVRVQWVYANGESVANLGNSLNPELQATLASYRLGLQLDLDAPIEARVGTEDGATYDASLDAAGDLYVLQYDRPRQSDPMRYEVLLDETVVTSGEKAAGWGQVTGSRWGLLVSVPQFWQKYPKGLHVTGRGHVNVDLTPSPETLQVGMGTRNDVLFYFYPAADAGAAPALARGMAQQPLLARTTPQRYADTGVFYALTPGGETAYPELDTYVDVVTTNHLANRETLGLYSNLRFGDVARDQWEVAENLDESTWGNNYYDAALTNARLFAQSGDPRHLDVLVPMARHFMETDCWNTYDEDDWMNGYNPAYGAFHRSVDHFQHHYGEGIWYYYYLTGDERAREIGLRAANSIVYRQGWANENVDARMAYQRGSAVLEAWKATRDSVYLEHAHHLLVDKILATQDRYGVIGSNYAEGVPNIGPEQSWMMGLYSDALWKYLQENPDEELIDRFALLADFFDEYARQSTGSEEYWNLFNAPSDQAEPLPLEGDPEPNVYWFSKGHIAGTYAYAYDLTGDERYRTLARDLLAAMWAPGAIEGAGMGFWGKGSSQVMKSTIHAVALVSGETSTAGEPHPAPVPHGVTLRGSYPNPFAQATTLRFDLSAPAAIEVAVFDLLGRQVLAVPPQPFAPGTGHQVRLDAGTLAPGIYLFRLRTTTPSGAVVRTGRVTLVR